MTEKIKISRLVIVEGKYDKIKLSSIVDADIVTTSGFGIFKDIKKRDWIRSCIEKKGAIVLTDSDDAGRLIRNHIKNVAGKELADSVIHLYIPPIEGKERRKKTPSKEGLIGVEGIEAELLRALLLPYASGDTDALNMKKITKADLYNDGLSGAHDSSTRRQKLIKYFSLPQNLTAGALIDALNIMYSYDEYKKALAAISEDEE